jgi:hypothetical protein
MKAVILSDKKSLPSLWASILLLTSICLAAINCWALSLFLWVAPVVTLNLWTIAKRRQGVVYLYESFDLIYIVYASAVPISFFLQGAYADLEDIKIPVLLCITASFGLESGSFLFNLIPQKSRSMIRLGCLTDSVRPLGLIGPSLLWLGVLASVLAIQMTTGFSVYLSAGYAGRALLKRENGPLEIGIYIACIGYFSILADFLLLSCSLSPRKLISMVSFPVLMTVVCTFLGIRRPIFLLLVGIFTGLSVVKNKPGLRVSALVILPAVFILGTFAEYRQLISSNDGGLDVVAEFIASNASLEWLDFSQTELGAPFRTLTDYSGSAAMIRDAPFLTYLTAPINLLPSFAGIGYQTPSVIYTNKFFTSEFISIGGNMGFFPVTEAYLNFGWLGVFPVFVVTALVLRGLDRLLRARSKSSSLFVVLFMILVPWLAFYMRLDFASWTKGLFYSQLMPLFFVLSVVRFAMRRGGDA